MFDLILMCVLYSVLYVKVHSNALFHSATSVPNNTSSSHSHAAPTIHLPPEHPTHASMHTIEIHPTHTFPAGTIIPAPLHTRPPHPPPRPPPPPPPQQSGQKPIFVVFEVLGGLVASALLLGLLRCCYQYNKAPRRDRIPEFLSRHRLEQEMNERERGLNARERGLNGMEQDPLNCVAAPAYVPRPPSYKTISRPTTPNSTDYTDLDTRNSPSSPTQSAQLITPRPAG